MKLESMESSLPGGWRRFLRVSSFDSAESSETTIFVEAEDAALKHRLNVPVKRRVRFCEDKNQVYATPGDHAYVVHDRWYTRKELYMCRAETRCLALLAGDSNRESESVAGASWPNCLQQQYLSFCACQGEVNQEVITPTVPPCEVSVVGLERRVLAHTVARDKQDRRRRLLQNFYMIYDTVVDPETRAYLIAQASAETTLPSRRYAAFLAEWRWHAVDGDGDGEQEI